MIGQSRCALVIVSALAALATVPSLGQTTPVSVPAVARTVESRITGVTLYRGRASVTRSATLTLDPGVYDLQFGNLPATVQPATLQARSGGSLKVIGVDFVATVADTSGSPQIAELDSQIERIQLELNELVEQRMLLKAHEDFIASISVKSAQQVSETAGTDKLDVGALRKLIDFVTEERTNLLAARRELDGKQRELEKQLQAATAKRQAIAGTSNINRTAVVSVVATDPSETTIDLTYLVGEATWEPTYNVRAASDGSMAVLEYDAMITQRTGEDWDNVTLWLSTAQPTVAAHPPVVAPWFIDVQSLDVARMREEQERAAPEEPPPPSFRSVLDQADLKSMYADAQVAGEGPSVTFQLPRLVIVKSDMLKQQRTRIANIDTQPKLIHVAVPLHTDAVYLRGDLVNASEYQLLPGRASIFFGQDYVGPTTLESVAPGGSFKVHFGIDQSVKAARHLVHKHTENTGLLSGGRRTSYDYRLTLDNGSGKPILVEMWDRYPVSRNSEIQVELVDVSSPLSADAYYTTNEQPSGLLKWILNVPAGAAGRSAHVVSYGVRINRAKDLQMTPLPE